MSTMELSVVEFVELLSTAEPAPGGGASSALTGAIGIALTNMVANLTMGKEKYKDNEALINDIINEAKELKKFLTESIDRDVQAYKSVINAYKLPKSTEEEKRRRMDAIQNNLKSAAIVPFNVMEHALFSLRLTEKAVGKSNTNAVTDLGISAINLKSAIQGAWLNVLINLKYIKDEKFVGEYEAKGKIILEEAISTADRIYQDVVSIVEQ